METTLRVFGWIALVLGAFVVLGTAYLAAVFGELRTPGAFVRSLDIGFVGLVVAAFVPGTLLLIAAGRVRARKRREKT